MYIWKDIVLVSQNSEHNGLCQCNLRLTLLTNSMSPRLKGPLPYLTGNEHASMRRLWLRSCRRWVALSAASDPCAACGGAVALAGRDGRRSVPPAFPHSVWARAFYAVLELPAAVFACCRDG